MSFSGPRPANPFLADATSNQDPDSGAYQGGGGQNCLGNAFEPSTYSDCLERSIVRVEAISVFLVLGLPSAVQEDASGIVG
jgi:hypothetical protein